MKWPEALVKIFKYLGIAAVVLALLLTKSEVIVHLLELVAVVVVVFLFLVNI